jgi:hypothetical protein
VDDSVVKRCVERAIHGPMVMNKRFVSVSFARRRGGWRSVCAAILLGFATSFFAQAETNVVYVSMHGNDTWSGVLAEPNREHTDGPVASLEGARDALRRLRSTWGRDWPSRVEIGDGTYLLEAPLVLGLIDSGAPATPIVYGAAPGAHPVFSGGRRIHGWVRGEGAV